MELEGYKLGFLLHAIHTNLEEEQIKDHKHMFVITLYFQNVDKEMDSFEELEKQVNDKLLPYQNKKLSDTELFKNCETTVENMAECFFKLFKEMEKSLNIHLLRLDIQDNLLRTYSVSDVQRDASINEIAVIPIDFANSRKMQYTKMEKPKEEKIIAIHNVEKSWSGSSEAVNTDCKYLKENASAVEIKSQDEVRSGEVKSKKHSTIETAIFIGKVLLSIGFFIMIYFGIIYIIRIGGNYPQGSDTLCHLYRSDLLLQNIKKGNIYPLYDSMWYNGVEIMRYWAPLPLYILAGIQYVIGGTSIDAYVVFCGLVYLVGAMGWLAIGIYFKRIGLAVFLGTAWFFFPENLRLLILDGNLPRVIINTVLPFLLLCVWRFAEERKDASMVGIILLTAFMGLCHIGITFMVIVCTVIFISIYSVANKRKWLILQIVLGMVLGLGIIGIWMIPSLIGGAASKNSGNQVMALFFEEAFISLNPIYRYKGDMGIFYYGISIFAISIFGTVFGTKKTLPGFLSTLIIFLCTTKAVYHVFVHLPFSQFLWMIRFVTISFAFFVLSIFLWKELKKVVVLLMCALLLIDCWSSIPYIYVKPQYRNADQNEARNNLADQLLMNKAKEITRQRMAIMELSTYGAFAPYWVAGVGEKRAYTFGAGWEGAKTAENIVSVNTALEQGRYYYLFDRCIELGTDTVLFPIQCLKQKEQDIDAVIQIGKKLGYELIEQNDSAILFQLQLGQEIKSFGVITQYDNLAIGDAAKGVSLIFPSFEEGSTSLDEYSVQDLCAYKKIYLSDFTYSDKKEAEDKLLEVSKKGVKVIIDMNRIPVNKKNNCYELLGVTAQNITFSDEFPTLTYQEQKYQTESFPEEMSQWNTVYLTGLSTVSGQAYMDNKILPFAGEKDEDNIIFLGFNLVYQAQITSDPVTDKLISEIFSESEEDLPNREIVPLKITYGDNEITICSDRDKVNSTLACLDIFSSDKKIEEINNLLYVNNGETKIKLHYPYLKTGFCVSFVASVLAILYCLYLVKRNKRSRCLKSCCADVDIR